MHAYSRTERTKEKYKVSFNAFGHKKGINSRQYFVYSINMNYKRRLRVQVSWWALGNIRNQRHGNKERRTQHRLLVSVPPVYFVRKLQNDVTLMNNLYANWMILIDHRKPRSRRSNIDVCGFLPPMSTRRP